MSTVNLEDDHAVDHDLASVQVNGSLTGVPMSPGNPPGRWTPARDHARSVWGKAQFVANNGVSRTGERDLRLIGYLAHHVSTCTTCDRRWIYGDRPVDHLERWIRRSSAKDIWLAAVRSAA